MTEYQKIKNILAFLAILFGEDKIWWDSIMKFNPSYIIEKFERYIDFTPPTSATGLHTNLRTDCFDRYLKKYKIPNEEKKQEKRETIDIESLKPIYYNDRIIGYLPCYESKIQRFFVVESTD
jgi:hypothetical protein